MIAPGAPSPADPAGAAPAARDRPRVAHLDHTSASGGAELALARMLSTDVGWQPLLLIAPSGHGGVYGASATRVPVRVRGVAQPAGVSGGGRRAVVGAAARLVVQAAVTRVDPAFRTADVVDANTARAAAYGALAARSSRARFVIHLRDLVEPDSLGGVGFAMMSRIALPRADGVIANSRSTLETARPFLRADAITAVIPSASGLVREPRGRPGAAQDGPLRVGMLARIDPWKGQLLLVDAFAAAFPDGDERLELAGGAPFGHEAFADRVRSRARELGIQSRVTLLGHVKDVGRLLREWDIGVQASLRPEPLGQNVLQYLAAGVPSIVADEGGPAEWIEDGRNGIRVPPRDPAALGAALRALASDPALRARISSAAVATPGLLTDAEVVRAHAAFYADVLRTPHSP